jgi:aminoglycoside/choline kinase family phosphotransferase
MTAKPLPSVANASYLTDVLRRSGVLARGSVCGVTVDGSLTKLRSHNVRLRLTYDGAGGNLPASIFLKTGHLDRTRRAAANIGQNEVRFYREIAPAVPSGFLPHCFEAQRDGDSGDWHILLEDLGASHRLVTEWPLPPTPEQCEAIIDARARFHAVWWNHKQPGIDVSRLMDAAAVARFLQSLGEELLRFVDRHPELMPAHRRELYERLLQRAPDLLAQPRRRTNLTIVHRDAHVWNCMLPRDGGADVRLIDWEAWRVDKAAVDLAYMMAIHWYPDRRRSMERRLLNRYHATLLAHGVRDYDRATLDEDYRFAVLWHITTPIWQSANGIPPRVWWNNLERILMAVDDLGCRELLG